MLVWLWFEYAVTPILPTSDWHCRSARAILAGSVRQERGDFAPEPHINTSGLNIQAAKVKRQRVCSVPTKLNCQFPSFSLAI